MWGQRLGGAAVVHVVLATTIYSASTMSSRKKKSSKLRYFSSSGTQNGKRSNLDYCSDKRLLPRIKQVSREFNLIISNNPPVPQYLEDCSDDVIDIDDMAVTLQAQYPEYTRKKRLAFRALVAKVYSGTLLNEGSSQTTSVLESEEWLERREREHVMKRRDDFHQDK